MRGFSTIEMLIAFAVMTLGLSAVMVVSFGNQSMTIDTELANRALYVAERELELARASAIEDFASLSSLFTAKASGELYDKEIKITDISECVKRAESIVTWQAGSRNQQTSLSTVVTDPQTSFALGHDCDTTAPINDWDNPDTFVAQGLGGQGMTSIDVADGFLYSTSNKFPPLNNHDFFIYELDISGRNLISRSSLDLNRGANVVDVAWPYAYVGMDSRFGQLQVIDLSNPSAPDVIESASSTLATLTASLTCPNKTSKLGDVCPAAISIYYYDEKVYIGTEYLPAFSQTQNHEFHIFNVSNPAHPVWEGSVNINHHVYDIVVQGSWAYLATSDPTRELMAINVDSTDPNYLRHPDGTGFGLDAPGTHHASAVFALGSKLYLGRKQNTNSKVNDFFVLNRDNLLDAVSVSDGVLGSKDLDLQKDSYVTGVVVRGDLAFIGMDDPNSGLQIWNISDPANMQLPSSCGDFNFSENSTDVDFDHEYVFTVGTSNDELRVIYDDNSVSCE